MLSDTRGRFGSGGERTVERGSAESRGQHTGEESVSGAVRIDHVDGGGGHPVQGAVGIDADRPVCAERAHGERHADCDTGAQELHRVGQPVGVAEHGVRGGEKLPVILGGAIVVVDVHPCGAPRADR